MDARLPRLPPSQRHRRSAISSLVRKLALTGATSGVGLRLAEIARGRGLEVVALVRDPGRATGERLRGLGVELIRGDLEDEAALAELARGAEVLVHLAAHVGDHGRPEEFVRVNVGGTARVVRAAAAGGVRRFVHLSSTAVYGRPDEGRVDESWPTRYSGAPYDDTKVDAERTAFATGRELGLEVVALRPPIIYGPYDRNFMPRMVESLRRRRFPLIGGGRAPLNVVWVDHLCDVIFLAAERDEAIGEAFNVMDEVAGWPPTVREVAEVVADAHGLPRPSLSIPFGLAYAASAVIAAVAQRRDPNVVPLITPFVVKILTRHVIYDASKAARLLGFSPRKSALVGLRDEARASAARARGEDAS
jgi:2-alkyl-3-oxoalkanoate reductase